MNCQDAQILISAWLDHELTDPERDLLETHLHSCETCRHEKAELSRLQDCLVGRRLNAPEVSATQWSLVERRLRHRRSVRWVAWGSLAACLVALVSLNLPKAGPPLSTSGGNASVAASPLSVDEDFAASSVCAVLIGSPEDAPDSRLAAAYSREVVRHLISGVSR